MTKIFRITTCAVLVLVLFLAAPAAMAADRDTGNQASAEHEIGLDWWAYLESIWASLFDGPEAPEPPGDDSTPAAPADGDDPDGDPGAGTESWPFPDPNG